MRFINRLRAAYKERLFLLYIKFLHCQHTCFVNTLPDILLLKFRRVTIRGAQPSARLSEEICGGLSEGSAGVSPRALRGLSEGSAGSRQPSPGVRGIFPRVFGGSDPTLVTRTLGTVGTSDSPANLSQILILYEISLRAGLEHANPFKRCLTGCP